MGLYYSYSVLFNSPVKSNEKNNNKVTKRLTKNEKNKFKFYSFLKDILIGMILSDDHLRKFSILPTSFCNARVIFAHSLKQADFLYHLFYLFTSFCASPPKIQSSIIQEKGNIRKSISFSTRCLPCFNVIYDLFFYNKIKCVPSNIEELLTNISLAYWIMSDGSWSGYGIKLCTNNFTKSEVELLSKVLNPKFNFYS